MTTKKSRKYVGAHVPIAGGLDHAPQNADRIGARAFALFTRNQRSWKSKPLTEEAIQAFKEQCVRLKFAPEHILPHDSYLINLGCPDLEKLEKSRTAFLDEMQRCEQLGLCFLNFHPGAHLEQMSETACLALVAESVNQTLKQTRGVTAVIENTAGQGSNVGYRFEHIAEIIDRIEDKSRIGVCFDTCHTFAAGYDLRTLEDCDRTFAEFDRVIGLSYLKGMHINDAKSTFASRVDRHHNLREGNLGETVFRYIMNDKRFDNIPLILETRVEDLWPEEIAWLYSLEKPRSRRTAKRAATQRY